MFSEGCQSECGSHGLPAPELDAALPQQWGAGDGRTDRRGRNSSRANHPSPRLEGKMEIHRGLECFGVLCASERPSPKHRCSEPEHVTCLRGEGEALHSLWRVPELPSTLGRAGGEGWLVPILSKRRFPVSSATLFCCQETSHGLCSRLRPLAFSRLHLPTNGNRPQLQPDLEPGPELTPSPLERGGTMPPSPSRSGTTTVS